MCVCVRVSSMYGTKKNTQGRTYTHTHFFMLRAHTLTLAGTPARPTGSSTFTGCVAWPILPLYTKPHINTHMHTSKTAHSFFHSPSLANAHAYYCQPLLLTLPVTITGVGIGPHVHPPSQSPGGGWSTLASRAPFHRLPGHVLMYTSEDRSCREREWGETEKCAGFE